MYAVCSSQDCEIIYIVLQLAFIIKNLVSGGFSEINRCVGSSYYEVFLVDMLRFQRGIFVLSSRLCKETGVINFWLLDPHCSKFLFCVMCPEVFVLRLCPQCALHGCFHWVP